MEINDNQISNARLISQRIGSQEFTNPNNIVRWMGAIQAQDYSMAKWAIGVRLSDPDDKRIESCLDKGEILRIHILRPTWHFISADDIYWMLKLSASKIKSSLKSRHRELELTESVIARSQGIIEKKLLNGSASTREELAGEFHNAGIRTDANRLSHILFRAEIDGIICSGPKKRNKLTYSLLHERVPRKKDLSREDALAELAKRYFISRCPATLDDFVWWSNLSVSDARKALESVKHGFYAETSGSKKYWFPNSCSGSGLEKTSVHLLPAYDEFLISYRDRSSSLASVNNTKLVSDNGIFNPSIVINGQVAGLWRRTIKKNKVIIETRFFQTVNKYDKSLIVKQAQMFGKFLNVIPIELTEIKQHSAKYQRIKTGRENQL